MRLANKKYYMVYPGEARHRLRF